MAEIADRWSEAANTATRARSADALDDVNVVVILSESFSDPDAARGHRVGRGPDPLHPSPDGRPVGHHARPAHRRRHREHGVRDAHRFLPVPVRPADEHAVPAAGAELHIVPIGRRVPASPTARADRHPPVPAAPCTSGTASTRSSASTSSSPRSDAAPERHRAQRRSSPTTRRSTRCEYQIDRADQPLLVNLVTMQNHYPMADKYDDPIPSAPRSAWSQAGRARTSAGLEYSDEAMKEFLAELEDSAEKTAVVFYGDHLPPFWPTPRSASATRTGAMQDAVLPVDELREAPDAKATRGSTSPMYFLPMLFDALRRRLPPYYALLDELHQQVPAMAQGEYHDDGRQVVTDPTTCHAGPKAVLHDYRLVQYDLAVGERYSEDAMFYPDRAESAASLASRAAG